MTDQTDDRPTPLGAPTGDAERIASLDVLRGFAVLGILVMNVQSFSMVGAAYMNPTVFGDLSGANYGVWYFSHLLADQKFMTLFSMLFGAGVFLMSQRRRERGLRSAGLHYRRMGWLLVFGLLHAYLLWYGDILVTYALCGLVIYPLRRLPPWLLALLGLLALCIPWGLGGFAEWSMPHWPEEAIVKFAAEWAPPAAEIDRELAVYRGSWVEQMPDRAEVVFYFQTFVFAVWMGWRAGGVMLLGVALYRWGVFSGERSNAFYGSLMALAALAGIPLVAYGVHRNFAADWSVSYSFFSGRQYNYWGSLLVAMGHVGAVMLLCRLQRLKWLVDALARVGQMALTNYLVQTLICTTIFYGHGFGQFGRFSRVEQLLTVLAVWAVQLIYSPLWLRYFRFGPFEWLWRSLSYARLQPLRRPSRPGLPARP